MLDKIVYAKHLKICHNILIQNQLFFRVLLLFWDALLSNFIKNNRNEKKLVSCYSYIAKFEVFCIDNFIKHYSPISEGWEPSQGFRKFGFFSHPPWKVFGKFCTHDRNFGSHITFYHRYCQEKHFTVHSKVTKIFLVEIKVL